MLVLHGLQGLCLQAVGVPRNIFGLRDTSSTRTLASQVVNIMDMEVPTTIEFDDIYIVSWTDQNNNKCSTSTGCVVCCGPIEGTCGFHRLAS